MAQARHAKQQAHNEQLVRSTELDLHAEGGRLAPVALGTMLTAHSGVGSQERYIAWYDEVAHTHLEQGNVLNQLQP